MKKLLLIVSILFLIPNLCFAFNFNKKENKMISLEQYQKTIMFPIGVPNDAYAKYFIGQSYIAPVST